MNTKNEDYSVHEELECPICTRLFHEPVTTACGHSFCKGCLLSVLDRDDSKCPLCRALFYSGMRDIPISQTLKSVIEKLYPDECRQIASDEAQIHSGSDTGRRNIPLFVMSALFPNEKMALNIFEPRYRLLIRRAMESNRRFGVAAVSDGPHGIAPVITEVELDRCDTTPDGRYLIEIHGLRRYEYERIENQDGYAVAVNTTVYEDDEVGDEAERAEVDEYVEGINGLLDRCYATNLPFPFLRELLYERPAKEDVEGNSWLLSALATLVETRGNAQRKLELLKEKSMIQRFRKAADFVKNSRHIERLEDGPFPDFTCTVQ